MKFDPRLARKKPPKNRNSKKPWDLRSYKVRKSQFEMDLRGKDISKEVLKIFGEEMVKAIKEEAKRASGLGTGIPRTKDFLDSFYYEIKKGGTIKIKSDWQWVKKYLDRKEPYEMTWLTRKDQMEKKVIPIRTKNGEVVFRSLPLRTEQKWIHPAVYKFNFIEQGIEKGRMKAMTRAIFYLNKKTTER
tara:strand:- start:59 stop:622 length:564 start_codon:yes stop_codon:yes gene_type:complete